MKHDEKIGIFLMLPIALWSCLFFIIPIVFVIHFMFLPIDQYGIMYNGFTLKHFRQAFGTPGMSIIALKTLVFNLMCALTSVFLSSVLVYLSMRSSRKFAKFIFYLMIFQSQISFISRCFAYKLLFSNKSPITAILIKFNFVYDDISFLFSWGTSFLVTLLLIMGITYISIYQGAIALSKNILDAASDLGANNYVIFFKIFIPNIRKSLIFSYNLTIISSLGMYFVLGIVGGLDQMLMENKISDLVFSYRNFPLATIYSFVLIFVVIAMYVFGHFVINMISGQAHKEAQNENK